MKNKNDGFTLIELVITIAIISILAVSLTSLLTFSRQTYEKGQEYSGINTGISTYLKYITKEIQIAKTVEILDTMPTNLQDGYNYIYMDNNFQLITQKGSNADNKLELNGLSELKYNLSLNFERLGSKKIGVSFESSQDVFKKTIMALNLQQENLTNDVKGLEGPIIKYKINTDGNDITFLGLKQSNHNDLLLADVDAVPQGNNIILNFSGKLKSGKDISDLINVQPDYITNASKIEVKGIEQESGVTTVDLSNPLEYDAFSSTGSKNTYTVYTVNELPIIGGTRILPYDSFGNLQPYAWETSTLVADDTSFNSNNNGTLDYYEYRWYKSGTLTSIDRDKNPPNMSSFILMPETTSEISAINLKDNWVAVEIRPIMDTGIVGDWVISSPIFVYEEQSKIWEDIVSDLWYLNADEATQNNFNIDYGSDYSNEITVLDHISETDLINVDIIEQKIHIKGKESNHNLMFSIPIEPYAEDIEAYTLRFDVELNNPDTTITRGWGVGINSIYPYGTDDKREQSFLFQFDPGAAGFVVRKNDPNHNVEPWFGARSTSTNLGEPGHLESGYGAPYRPTFLENNVFNWNGDNTENSDYWWTSQGYTYTTELLFQRQIDGEYRIRGQFWLKDKPSEKSEPMWFGDFGNITLQDNFNYQGNNDLAEFRSDYDLLTKYIGFRTWGNSNGYDNKYDINFNNLEVSEGIKINIQDAIKLSNNQLLINFEPYKIENREDLQFNNINNIKLTDTNGNYLIKTSNGIEPSTALNYGSKGVIVEFKEDFIVENPIINIKRGFIEQEYIGDVDIANGYNYNTGSSIGTVIMDEQFGSPTLNNWMKYDATGNNTETIEIDTTKYALKKINLNDPSGGYYELNNSIDTLGNSFILSYEVFRQGNNDFVNFEGGSQDRVSLTNNNGTGIGIGIINNKDNSTTDRYEEEFYLETRENTNPTNKITSQVNIGTLTDWNKVMLIYNKDTNTIISYCNGEILEINNARDFMPSSITRFYINGGYEFLLDNIKILKL